MLIAGVMNTAVTLDRVAGRLDSNEELTEALEGLPLSSRMETSSIRASSSTTTTSTTARSSSEATMGDYPRSSSSVTVALASATLVRCSRRQVW